MRPGSRRIARLAALAGVAAILAAGAAHAPPRTFTLRSATGAPIAEAHLGYYHASAVFDLVDSRSRYHPGRLVRADARGEVRIPRRLAVKRPLDGQPALRVTLVYVPALHNALGPLTPPGEQPRQTLSFEDLSGDPERWHRSLERLYSAVRFDAWPDGSREGFRYFVATRDELEPLVRAVEEEYAALHERYGSTPRPRPAPERQPWESEAEHEARLARLAEQRAREPLWGPHLERLWSQRLRALREDWERLPR